MNRVNHKWDQRFLSLAKLVASWSKDPSTKVGAVITNGKQIISLGFNGLPKEMEDLPEILDNREEKYKHIIHAELNAIAFANQDISGFTIYTYPFMPCDNGCAAALVSHGIKRVVSIVNENPRWKDSFLSTEERLRKAKVELTLYNKLLEPV